MPEHFDVTGKAQAGRGKRIGLMARRWSILLMATLLLVGGYGDRAAANVTGTWSAGGVSSINPNVGGVSVTISGSAVTGGVAETLNATNMWSNPYSGGTMAGKPSFRFTIPTPAVPTNAGTVTITFGKPVDNPVIHFDRFGGSSGTSNGITASGTTNSSSWTLASSVSTGGSVTLSRLSGNSQFTLSGSTFQRTPNVAYTNIPVANNSPECATVTTVNTGCGSILFTGTGISSLTFAIAIVGPNGADAVEVAVSVADTSVIYKKQTVVVSPGAFNFTGSNGIGSSTLTTTATTNPATSTTYTVTNDTQSLVFNETVPAGYRISSTSCVDGAGVTRPSTFSGSVVGTGTVTITAPNYSVGSTVTCTFVNTSRSDMSVSLAGLGPAALNVPYTGTYTCSNAAAPYMDATAATCAISGLPAGLSSVCSPTSPAAIVTPGSAITCTVSGTPTAAGTVTVTGTTSATNDLNLPNNTATASFVVQQSDMVPDLSGLPATASIGVAYSGTVLCTNNAGATGAAAAATCSISGLPAGVTVGTCTPVPPTSVAVGASISCPVSGTPTATGSVTVTATTGATNDSNGGTTTGGNNQATKVVVTTGADMQPNLSGLPATATVGVAYSGTILCTNSGTATAAAINATCSVSGLPAGVTVGACTPAAPATVAIGASMSCSVSGTPTAVGTSTVSAQTGATNDINGGTTSGGNNTLTKDVVTSGSDMSINLSGLPTSASIGVPYSGTFTCSNAASPSVTALSASCSVAGLPAGLTTSCSPSPPTSVAPSGIITCTVSGTPTAVGTSNLTGTTGATNDGVPANNTALASITTTGSDMTPNLSGLPTTATVGAPYGGTVLCTNNVSAAAPASNATCAISGLPAGVTVSSCTPVPPATVAAGASISCFVFGTPTAAGAVTVTATTGATNDTNGGTTTGGNNTATASVTTSGSDMSINLSGLPTSGSVGQPYTGTYTCTNASSPAMMAISASCAIAGLPAGLTSVCSPVPPTSLPPTAGISCTVSGTPTTAGSSTLNGSTGATNDPNVANNTATAAIAVTGSDMTPNLSGLPATATVGVAYSGTVLCTNNAGATAAAVAATCSVSGLPAGVTLGACTPIPPASVAIGSSISCAVSGTPTVSGSVTVTAVTGATNDTNGGVTTSGNNSATKSVATDASDMTIDLSGLPTTANLGVPYSGTYTCSNAASPAVAATSAGCAISGLPAGLTSSCSPVPPTTVVAAGVITCSVSGTPTATGSSTLNGTTGATNDGNSANNTATAALTVTGSDMTPSLAGLPATATVGTPYSGTVTCTNNAAATAPALAASCSVSGLPAGVSVGACTPAPPTTLAAGSSISCTVSGTPTASGTTTASATTGATNDTNGGTGIGGNNSVTKAVATTASDMSIDLSALPTSGGVGQPYAGTYTCSNASAPAVAATAASCAISGLPAGLTASCAPSTPTTVAAGASILCTVSGTPTAAGSSTLNGTTGATNDDNAANNSAIATLAIGTPALSIVKSSTTTSFATVGVSIPYSFAVTNSGTVKIVAPITVSDSKIATVSCPALPVGGLLPAASITCTGSYTTVQADLDAGGVTNLATATSGTTTSASTTHTVSATQTRGFTIAKTASPTTFSAPGVVVTYSYVVRNTGNVTIVSPAAISVSDNKIASVSCPALPVGGLAPNATLTCSATAVTTQADVDAGSIVNTASATDGTTTSPTTSATVTATQSPALTVVKGTTTSSVSAVGVVVPYTFAVTNSGNVTLMTAITVSDSKIASVSCPALPVGGLAPFASITCTGSYTTAQADLDAGAVVNAATAQSGATTSPLVLHNLPVNQARSLSLTKTPSPTTFSTVGATINYSYVVRNTGNITIPATATMSVADNKIASVTCPAVPVGGLAPNATITCAASTLTTQADIDAGGISNTASATDGTVTSSTVSATVTAVQTLGLTIAKSTTATTYSAVGTVIPYSFKVTNAGNVTLTSAVTVSDSRIASVSCPGLPVGGLAPGAFVTCSGNYTTAQGDLNSGSVLNTATAQSGSTTSPPVNHTLTATQTPAVSLVKSSTTTSFAAPGVTIPYSYRVTNSGNITLTSAVSVADNKIASVTCPALPVGGLVPGAFVTCTGNYTTVQADVDAGGITNIANASSGSVTSGNQTLTVPAVQSLALTVVKTSTATGYTTVGQSLPYSFKVTNSGNTTLTSAISVSDNRIASVSCPALPVGGLAPTAFVTCSGNYTVTQADIDAGAVTNTASATSGAITSPTTNLTINATQTRALAVAKSTTSTGYATVGTSIPYSFKVTNAGNVTLTSAVTVADSKIASVSCPALPVGGLLPGAFVTCSASYSVTQADIDAGSVTNLASATSGTTTSPTVSVMVPATQTPALSIVKSTTALTYAAVGDVIPYSFQVTNSGNTTLTSAVTVSDSKIGSVTCPPIGSGFAPSTSITCTGSYTVTQTDIDGGNVLNLAFAKSGLVQSPTVTYTLTGSQTPKLTISKASTTSAITTAGQSVPYTFTLTNTGNVTLTVNAAVSDSKIASVVCPAMPVGGLAPTQSIACTASYVVTQADVDSGSVVNTASATSGTPTASIVSNTTALTIPVTAAPAISLIKATTTTTFATVGAVIPYTFTVQNTGNTTITAALTVTDSKIATVTCPALPPLGLAPGASLTCTGSYTIAQSDIDAGSVVNTATSKSGTTITSPPAVHTLPATQNRALQMIKSASPTTYNAAGAVITYSYVVRNSGNMTIPASSPISVSDDKIASVSCPALPPSGLAPNATLTCTATYTITQANVDTGSVANNATATDGVVTGAVATATITATQTPALTIVKNTTVTSFSAVGVVVPYTFVVRNSGNVTLTAAIAVTDSKIAAVSCPALPVGGLLPAAQITCTGSYTTTQADLDAGSVVNAASAKSGTTTSLTASHTLPAAQTRSLSIVKTPTPTTYGTVGVVISYSYIVRNTGNITIPTSSPITVSDNKIASVSCPGMPVGGLSPNATMTCSASYTTVQSDVDAGAITNIASATDGTVTSPQVSATVTANQAPSLTVVKSTTATTYASVGAVIPYSFKVTNNGNTTLTQPVTVSDSRIAAVTCPALPVGGLVPAAFLTCSGSYTIAQADIDSGAVLNTATAKSGTVVSSPVTHTLTATQSPAVTMVKSTATTVFAAPGVVIPYSYKVTNSGNVTLTSVVSVSDNKISPVSCPALPVGGLVPAAFITCTASYTTTQADVNAGQVTNVASATSGTVTSPTATVTVPATQSPALSVVKSTSTVSFAVPGAVIAYNYRVTNSGNTTLIAVVTVADDKIASVSCPALPVGGLAPAAFITCTGSYTTTQTDVNAGGVTNKASATSGSTTSPQVSVTVPAVQTPSLSIAKSTTTANFNAPGVVIPFSYKITNSGNTTLTSAVSVSDNKIASVACPALPVGGLAPSAFITCTGNYTTTQADVDAGQVTNIASAASGTVTSPTATVTVNSVKTPAMTVVKSTPTTSFTIPGVVIAYSYKVTNSGNTTLTSAVSISDNKIAAVTCPALPVGGLLPSAFITCSASYTTTQADVDAGGITNTASSTSGPTTSPTVSLTVPSTQTPALTLVKSTPTTAVSTAGTIVNYSYKVTNSGNTTLTSVVTVADNKIAAVSCPALPVGGLQPAAFITCAASYTITQADIDAGGVTNIASAKSGSVTSPNSTVTVPATQTPGLVVVKSTTATGYNVAGVVIPYSYKVTNSGNITLTNAVTVSDNKIAAVSCPVLPVGGLVPAAFITCTGSYTVTQADVDAGTLTNTASGKSGTVTSPTVSVTLVATQTPGLTVLKATTTTNFATVGVAVPYTYKVTNSGNTTLTSAVSVVDDKIAAVICPALPAGGLLPAAFITCTGTYTTTQFDVDAGGVTNTASAKSGVLTSPTVSVTVPSIKTSALTTLKSTTVTTFAAPGVVIPYSYKVTNTGNTTLLVAIAVTDDKIAAVTCPALPVGGLAPAAFVTCTGSYTTTQADVDAGGVTNTASSKSGAVVSPAAVVTVTATRTPGLTVLKTSTTAAFAGVGTIVPYSYKVTNSGNTTLTSAIAVSDNKIASVACPALPVGGLLPAAFITCTGSYTTTQADIDAGGVTNIASAISGTVVSPTVTLLIPATQSPSLSIAKSSSVSSYAAAGVSIPYSYKVTNSGNTTLTSIVSVADDKIANVTCPALPVGGLLPAAFLTCTGSYTTTQADVDLGSVTNVASAKSGTIVSPTATLKIDAVQAPAISLVKSSTATGFETVGAVVPYTYTVRNVGNVTLTSAVTVTDDKIASVACPALPAGGLVPNASLVCTANYTIKQADINAGKVINNAVAAAGGLVSPTVTFTLNAVQKPDYTIQTSALTTAAVPNGDGTYTQRFRVVLRNTGNVDLRRVVALDNYQAQIPTGSTVLAARMGAAASSTEGPLTTANANFTGTSTDPALFTGTGENLEVGEEITVEFEIVFNPGPNPPGPLFENLVTAETEFNGGTPIAAIAVRTSAAPVMFEAQGPLTVTKTTPKADVTIGEIVPYTITVKSNVTFARTGLTVSDVIPAGFKYRDGSASIGGVAREPQRAGRELSWSNVTVPGNGTVIVKLMLVVGAGVGGGEFTNEAFVRDAFGAVSSNVGKATVRIVGDPTFDCTDIIGKVFDDKNQDGAQDDSERGIANVRLATVRGQLITTDSEGRFHIACADIPESDRGTNFILKLDERTLPSGYRVTTENPRVIRITKGKMAKINFGASISRVARLDLTEGAFEVGSVRLKSQWLQGLGQVFAALKQDKSVLRIGYRRGAQEDGKLADQRVKAVEALIRERWVQDGGAYPLVIEAEVYFERRAAR